MRELGTDAVPVRVPPARPSASVVPAPPALWEPTPAERPSVAVSKRARARAPMRARGPAWRMALQPGSQAAGPRAASELDHIISFAHRKKMRSGKIHELPKGPKRIIIDMALHGRILRAVMKVLWKGRDFFPMYVWKIIVTINCAIDVSLLPMI